MLVLSCHLEIIFEDDLNFNKINNTRMELKFLLVKFYFVFHENGHESGLKQHITKQHKQHTA